ncbi:hypothetical protein HK105_202683 [Polyrhizophydium stewartii]|uniref:2,5-diamino-6-ribosylamino-4(3H)-pyrimidinone 5'-phosphate reductase n=1 Tax=Polyrhizophydium stewartii TaxID=2732419 RepID=A0ABR4NE40_9FUNG|nr:hypothetical protein HK105_007341 [Polyrhizophydium stewartii]
MLEPGAARDEDPPRRRGLVVRPRLGEFSEPHVPLDEAAAFYSLAGVQPPDDRPYAWSNSVCTVDGVLHFGDGHHVSDVALRSVPHASRWSAADWRMLNTGWAHADAVLVTGEILRKEPDAGCIVRFDDLVALRTSLLGRAAPQPVQVVVSASGDFPLSAPLFTDPAVSEVWIATTPDAVPALAARLAAAKDAIHASVTLVVDPDPDPRSGRPARVDLRALFARLRKAGIAFLDVSAGGSLIRHCIDCGLLDEMRWTMAGQLAGPLDQSGVPRPAMFPTSGTFAKYESYTPHETPLLAIRGVRAAGDHLIMFRGEWEHRRPRGPTAA